jgi:hypothetical protein
MWRQDGSALVDNHVQVAERRVKETEIRQE